MRLVELITDRRGILVWLFLMTAVMTASPACAQRARDNVQEYIDHTAELLVMAEGLVAETGSEPARRVLNQARQLHERSQGFLRQDRPLEAMGVARRARDAVWHAVRAARAANGLEERIQQRAERFRDQLGQLVERAHEAGHGAALEFLDRAGRQAERARDMYRQGDFELAWKMLEQAEDLLGKAARLLGDSVGPERLERELERVAAVIERAGGQLAGNAGPRQGRRLAEAEEALQRALAARDQGRPGQALQLASLAEGLARRAADPAHGGPEPEAVQRQLSRFDARAERLADRVRDEGSDQARRLFTKAMAQRERADESARAGNQAETLRRIRAASELLDRTADLLR